MKITRGFDTNPDAIINFFAEVFEQSEGRDEGAVIRSLTQDLLNTTASDDLQIFSVKDFDNTIGIVAFSRLYFLQDPRVV